MYCWSFVNSESVDNATDKFTQTYLQLIGEHILSKMVTIRPQDKPWYDSEIRKTSRQRDRQKRKAIKTNNPSDWLSFKIYRNNLKKHAKEIFYSNLELSLLDFKSNSPRKYWKTIKMLLKDHSSNCNEIPPLTWMVIKKIVTLLPIKKRLIA